MFSRFSKIRIKRRASNALKIFRLPKATFVTDKIKELLNYHVTNDNYFENQYLHRVSEELY